MNQVLELENAILARAQRLADQFAEQAQRTRESVLREAAERLRQREAREEAIARALGDRHYRQRVQAAELKLQSNLDRVRWNLVRGVEARLEERMRAFVEDRDAYREHLLQLLREGVAQIDHSDIVVRVNARDRELLEAAWDPLAAEFPGQNIRIDAEPIETLAGVLLLSEDGRMRVDNTFEGRVARLRTRLQQAILERLLPATLESGNPFTG
ncbi:V-type ATP synthase subunit E [Thioalkalivibrio paradoxus]|uniref:V-type ATP synthase subunit E n=1 Tax=Thioalkalivibrio paradoxus ARh 1 TaxID=713585 RepID=W0DSF7_9GAMM|nr:V-type ATP synthase subunit E family protein [Thioalkalivibrio paradoxus]AHE99785.1 ATPase [Thioalkalivibrio paradoxus ARh 1]